MSGITINVTYTDIYGKERFEAKRKGTFFGRHFDKKSVEKKAE